jgi:hypothetical protein
MAFYDSPALYDAGHHYDESAAPSHRNRMAQVKLALRDKSLDQKADLADLLVTNMTGNATYANPSPALATLTTKATAARTKQTARNSALAALTLADEELATAEAELDGALTDEGAYIQSASGGDSTKIASSGAPIAPPSGPVGPMPAPQNLRATGGDLEGTADLQWDPVRGAKSYIGECASAATGPWTQVYVGSKSSTTADGLTSGTTYWFRVRAVGAAGPGPWSDPATKRAT